VGGGVKKARCFFKCRFFPRVDIKKKGLGFMEYKKKDEFLKAFFFPNAEKKIQKILFL
jgi:hypothetical protein